VEHDSSDRQVGQIAGTGQPGQDSKNRAIGTGQPEKKDGLTMTARKVQLAQGHL
jgi:hypothetical protein